MNMTVRTSTLALCILVISACGSVYAWEWPGEPGDPIGMCVATNANLVSCTETRSVWVTCVGSTVDFWLVASDYDFVYPRAGWDELSFPDWPGDPPHKVLDENGRWKGHYEGTCQQTYNAVGRYTLNLTASDAGNIYGDGDVQYEVVVIVVSLTMNSPVDDMRFVIGPGECDIAVVATVNGYYPADATYDVRWWITPAGGPTYSKPPMIPRGNGKYTGLWETDPTEQRGDWQVKVALYVAGQQMCAFKTADIFCAKPTWPICSGGMNGYIIRWLHLDPPCSWRGVDVDISGTDCSGTAPLLASEEGSASPHDFDPTSDPCGTVRCYANLVSYGTFNVRLIDPVAPTYDSRSLVTDHWHMMNAGRTSGSVDYHQSLGNGGYSGNVDGSHDHFITKVGGSPVSPDRTGAVDKGSYTDCDQQLHPDWN